MTGLRSVAKISRLLPRCRREYLKIDFEKLLADKKIDSNLLMPRPLDGNDERLIVSPYLPLEVSPPALPLRDTASLSAPSSSRRIFRCRPLQTFSSQIFDNVEFDCRTAEDWLVLGKSEGLPCRKPIPAKALLPTDDAIASGKMPAK